MGLESWLHWAAWFAKYFSFLLIDDILLTIIFTVDSGKGSVVNFTEPTLFFCFLIIYTVLVIWFCFAVSVFFNKGAFLTLKNRTHPPPRKRPGALIVSLL